MPKHPSTSLIRPLVRATLRRLSRRRELYLAIIVIGALLVQAGMLIIPVVSWPHNEFGYFPPNYMLWQRSEAQISNARVVLVRRPLWCGAIYLALPDSRVDDGPSPVYVGSKASSRPVVRIEYEQRVVPANLTLIAPEHPPTSVSMIEPLPEWKATISKAVPTSTLTPIDRPILDARIEPDTDYTEVLVVGWPWRIATLTARAQLTGRAMNQTYQYDSGFVPVSVAPPSKQLPSVLLNKIPTQFRYPALIASFATWAACIAAVVVSLLFATSAVRSWRSRCPACVYAITRDQDRCPECGLPSRS